MVKRNKGIVRSHINQTRTDNGQKEQRDSQKPYKSNKDRQWSKEKGRKEQTMIYKTLHRKLKISNMNPTKNWGELSCSGRISSSCSMCDTCHVTVEQHLHDLI
jgi:hypothetical protein